MLKQSIYSENTHIYLFELCPSHRGIAHWLNDDISFLPTLLNINMLDMWARAVVMIRDVNRVCVSYGSTM